MNARTTMNPAVPLAALVFASIVGCTHDPTEPAATGSSRNRIVLVCRGPEGDRPALSMFSFSQGEVVDNPASAELSLYFDGDDCAAGALVGHRDEEGWLFRLGPVSMTGPLPLDERPSDAETVAGIAPITPAQEGIAYRVRTVGDRYAIVRIVSVQPATYNDLLAGGTAQVEFEWDWESD